MEFIPAPPEQPSSLIKHQYYWKLDPSREGLYHLYQEGVELLSLYLPNGSEELPFMQMGSEVYTFEDSSSFFSARLCVIEKASGKCIGMIEKSSRRPGEGTISLQEQTYGWKLREQPDACLLIMDQYRRRLFSYHYGKDYIRLILNKPGRTEEQLVPLLSLGFFLLPNWH